MSDLLPVGRNPVDPKAIRLQKIREKTQKWRDKNRESYNSLNRRWRKKNPKKWRDIARRSLEKRGVK